MISPRALYNTHRTHEGSASLPDPPPRSYRRSKSPRTMSRTTLGRAPQSVVVSVNVFTEENLPQRCFKPVQCLHYDSNMVCTTLFACVVLLRKINPEVGAGGGGSFINHPRAEVLFAIKCCCFLFFGTSTLSVIYKVSFTTVQVKC